MENSTGLGKNRKKGGNPSTDLYNLQAINRVWKELQALGTVSGTLATEATLISVLNAIVASDQDIEILLVRDTGDSDVVVQQITNYETGTPVVTYKKVDGSAHTVVGPLEYLDPSAVLNLMLTESIDQGSTLDNLETLITALNALVTDIELNTDDNASETTLALIAADIAAIEVLITASNALLATIDADTSNLDVALSTRATEATLALIKAKTDLLSPATRTHTIVNTVVAGITPANTLRGSVLNAGSEAGTFNGAVIPAGVSVPWGEVGSRDEYPSWSFDPTTPGTGTTFIIEYTT